MYDAHALGPLDPDDMIPYYGTPLSAFELFLNGEKPYTIYDVPYGIRNWLYFQNITTLIAEPAKDYSFVKFRSETEFDRDLYKAFCKWYNECLNAYHNLDEEYNKLTSIKERIIYEHTSKKVDYPPFIYEKYAE